MTLLCLILALNNIVPTEPEFMASQWSEMEGKLTGYVILFILLNLLKVGYS